MAKFKAPLFERLFAPLANPLEKIRKNSWSESSDGKEEMKEEINEEIYQSISMVAEVRTVLINLLILITSNFRSSLSSRTKLVRSKQLRKS